MLIQGITLTGTPVNDGLVTNGLQLYLDSRNPSSWTGAGTTWYDLSPNAKHATFYQNVSPTDTGSPGSYEGTAIDGGTIFNNGYGDLRFDGLTADNVYQYAHGPNLGNSITQFTINSWFFIRTLPPSGNTNYFPCILTTNYTGSPSTVNFSLGFGTGQTSQDQKLYGGFFDGGWRVTTGVSINTGNWYNACVTYNGSTVTLYVNNVSSATLSYSSTSMTQTLGYRVARRWDNHDSIDGRSEEHTSELQSH